MNHEKQCFFISLLATFRWEINGRGIGKNEKRDRKIVEGSRWEINGRGKGRNKKRNRKIVEGSRWEINERGIGKNEKRKREKREWEGGEGK